MEIKDKVALVTGGASGLGAATVRMIAGAGGRAVIFDLNEKLGTAMVSELGSAVRFVRGDVAEPGDAEQAVKAATDNFGALHICANCAGIGHPQRTITKEGPADLAQYSRVIRTNLIGTFNVTRLAAWAISKSAPGPDGERGVIICTASVAAFDGQIGQAAYSASKGGIVGQTLPIARDLSGVGIRVVTIAPGLFDTPLLAALPEDVKASLGAMVPFPKRLGKPAEYAQLARQIIENPMLNGEVIRLDGSIRMAPK